MLRKILLMCSIVILATAAAEVAFHYNILEGLENIYYDLWHRLAGERNQPTHTAIVAIDELTLLEHADEPLVFWSPYFAQAIQTLREAGAAVIGLDIIFSVSAEAWLQRHFPYGSVSRTYDAALREQLAQGNVILAGQLVSLKTGEQRYVVSLEDYLYMLPGQNADVGLINMYTDADGVVRRFLPTLTAQEETLSGFGMLLASRTAGRDPSSAIPSDMRDMQRIRFMGPPGAIQPISFARLLKPNAADDPEIQRLKGKAVIIAAAAAGTQDVHQTPYSRAFFGLGGQWMSGPELHANIIETLLNGRIPRSVPFWLRLAYLIGFLALATFLFFRSAPWQGLGFGVLLSVVGALLAYLLFRADWLLPVANLQLAFGAIYLGALGFRLTGEERERARIRRIFGQFVSDNVVDHLVAAGNTPDLGGAAYQVTVLFSDIRNFTTISEKLTPAEVVEMLNAYFSRVCEPILAEGGMINKFIGDAVMAVFGAPAPFPDHAQRAIRAALGMKKAAEEFRGWMQTRFPGKELPEFRTGIGVHSGEAVLGNIGSTKRMEYTAIGDTVNTASRLESASKELRWTIVASAATISASAGIALTGGHDDIHVKGREQAVEVFEVIGVKA